MYKHKDFFKLIFHNKIIIIYYNFRTYMNKLNFFVQKSF
jgi:hypothetical protein